MKQDNVTIGMQARVKIGSRLATVTVLRQIDGRGRARFECRTSDTGRLVRATAARLRQMPPPAARAADPVAAAAAACGWDAAWLRDHMEAWIGRAAATPLDRCGLRRAIVAAIVECPTRPMLTGWPEMVEAGEQLLEAELRLA